MRILLDPGSEMRGGICVEWCTTFISLMNSSYAEWEKASVSSDGMIDVSMGYPSEAFFLPEGDGVRIDIAYDDIAAQMRGVAGCLT